MDFSMPFDFNLNHQIVYMHEVPSTLAIGHFNDYQLYMVMNICKIVTNRLIDECKSYLISDNAFSTGQVCQWFKGLFIG